MLFRSTVIIASLLSAVSSNAHEPPASPEEIGAYIQEHLQVFDIQADYIKTYSDDRVPAFRYALKNTGPETLTKVRVMVYFLDDSGLPFFEEDYLPVLVTASGFNDDSPLRPNYTFRMEQGQWMTEKRLGDEWSGEIRIEIVEVEFAE
ncbi:hypothetical protein [Shimia sediminis]|uniref:hypothetical protein n=1 Tax=Shimia sediminis TaxID=2497945 RepID=UPI000F8CD216|nr:hypothetical protein [Shimia sediminis]